MSTLHLSLSPISAKHLRNLAGPLNENYREIETALNVEIRSRGAEFVIDGGASGATLAKRAIEMLSVDARKPVSLEQVQLALVELKSRGDGAKKTSSPSEKRVARSAGKDGGDEVFALRSAEDAPAKLRQLKPRTPNQEKYLDAIAKHDITFGIGPAGTGKTYLAVAAAVDALERDAVQRIVLVRPAVEAGERLGFLPGDLAQKVDPYLRPLYDALYDLLGFDKTLKLIERQVIEIAPLAYMRGRTLNSAFIILDEAQNTTPEQMKMFLTRVGFGARVVVTGDTTQIDLQRGQKSGLIDAQQVLKNVKGIAFTPFTSADVVRHPVVQRIVEAYAKAEKRKPE
jgi:phosphate starvation-inducible PhoH-like protein